MSDWLPSFEIFRTVCTQRYTNVLIILDCDELLAR